MINNTAYENSVSSIYKLKVSSGIYAGIYDIKEPIGLSSIDCKLSIDDEYFNVNDFILGDSVKMSFSQYHDEKTYNLIKNVYEEQGGDGEILFIWQETKGDEVIDVIGENYALNLNKYVRKYSKSRWKIDLEVKKRESQNKILTREDITVDLFSDKDLDGNTISPVSSTDVFYKEQPRKFSNFYFFTYGQSTIAKVKDWWMYSFTRGDGFEFGDNTNIESGYMLERNFMGVTHIKFKGFMFWSNTFLNNISIELSNFNVGCSHPFKMYVIKKTNSLENQRILLESSVYNAEFGYNVIQVQNKKYSLGELLALDTIDVFFIPDAQNIYVTFTNFDNQASMELHTERIIPIRKTKSILLKDAVSQLVKSLTSSEINLNSNIIDNGGYYENTAVATGIILRGVSELYLGKSKLNTSLKSLLYDSAFKLMALGFDVQDNNIIIEDTDFFFKDLIAYDLSDKEYLHNSLEINNDSEDVFNMLSFGSKKFSTNNKDDIRNFNTKLEATTPIKSIKNKFDKTIDCIIDDNKIQELIADKSSKTSDNDDDIALIDLVTLKDYIDDGILTNCIHRSENNRLVLVCIDTPFDTLAIQIGDILEIVSGLNAGSHSVINIDKSKIYLSKTSGIQEGISDTIVRFKLRNITKNRLSEGFINVDGIKGNGASNLRHNPKYHMARWFGYYGSGLTKKLSSESIVISNYKNNGNVTLQADSVQLDNEYQGLVKLNSDEELGRLRNYKIPYFSGESISVTLKKVSFSEFMKLYNNWRYGTEGYDTSRGYIVININNVNYNVYLYGADALIFNMAKNQLTINGKIKNINYGSHKFKIFDYTFDYTFE